MKKLKRISIKTIAVLLSVLMVLFSFPLSVLAQDRSSESVEAVSKENEEIIELKSERTATTKTFRLADGSYAVAQYETDVHYMDGSGIWQDIDNSLSAEGSEVTTSNARVKFAKKTTGNGQLFTLQDGNKKLTLALDGAAKKVEGEITNYETQFEEDTPTLQKMMTLDKVSASVTYAEILPGVDLEYVVRGLDIKENIIVKEKGESYSYSFTMSLNNLSAQQNENGEIILSDAAGEAVYLIPAPVAWDASGETTDRVSMTLTDLGNGKYTLTVTADSEWMNEDGRAYPVTVDPPIYCGRGSSVLDLYISSSSPNTSNSTSGALYVSETQRSYWKLTSLPSLPEGAYITKATFSAAAYYTEEMDGYVGVYEVTSAWDSTLTWNQSVASTNAKGTLSDAYVDYQWVDFLAGLDDVGHVWNITPIVKKWYDGQNYGLALAAIGDNEFEAPATFYSDNYSPKNLTPRLCINYRDMKGLEDYWSFSSQSAGFAGTGGVNHATGSLVFTIPTLTSTDALMPITPTLVYDSAMAGKDYVYTNAQVPNESFCAPVSMKLNLYETLLKVAYTAHVTGSDGISTTTAEKYYIVWSDGDGTEHYFLPTDTANVYEDEDGLLLTLTENADGSCTITDSGKNIRTFTAYTTPPSGTSGAWYLSEIADKSGNRVTLGYTEGKISSVDLVPNNKSAIEQLKIVYNTQGTPKAVWNPTSGEAVMFLYSSTATGTGVQINGGRYLRQVKRVHGTAGLTDWASFETGITVDAIADYTYDTSGRLLTVTNNLSKYKLAYTYDTAGRLTAVKEWALGTATTAGQEFTLSYGTYSTVIRTSGTDDTLGNADDLITTYSFDESGRTVSCYTTDLERTQIYGASYGEYVGEENEKAKNNLKSSVQTVQHSPNYLLGGGFESASGTSLPYWSTSGTVGTNSLFVKSGNQSAALTVNSSVSTTAISQSVALDAGEYTLSAYVQTMEAEDLTVTMKVTSGNTTIATEEIAVNEYYASGSFVFTSLSFESAPTTTGGKQSFDVCITVMGDVDNAITVYVDDVMLAKTLGAAEYDSVRMGHFETTTTATSPTKLWNTLTGDPSNPGVISVVDSGIEAFGDVLKIENGLEGKGYSQQVIYSATDEDRSQYDEGEIVSGSTSPLMYTFSAWGKTAQAYYGTECYFGLQIAVEYYQGTGNSLVTKTYNVKFDASLTDWQFLSHGFATEVGYGMVNRIYVRLVNYGLPEAAFFDGITAIENSNLTEIYDYNSNGYLSSYKTGSQYTLYEYDDNNNLFRSYYLDRSFMQYDYDALNRVIGETYFRKVKATNSETGEVTVTNETVYATSYTYDAFGLLTSTVTYDGDTGTDKIQSDIAYETAEGSHIFGALLSETNSLGQSTRYFYNTSNGRLLAVTYPEGNGVSYTYDAIGNVTNVLPAVLTSTGTGYTKDTASASVDYTYDATNRLNKIQTDSTTYTFVYDSFGNTTNISAGSNTLASYTYNPNNGKLSAMTYGNGLQVNYVYDVLDRLSELWYNTGTGNTSELVYSYKYNSAGALYSVTDHKNNTVTMYEYDTEGRLIYSYTYDEGTDIVINGNQVSYDDESRVDSVAYDIDYHHPTGADRAGMAYFYSYDKFGRLSSYDLCWIGNSMIDMQGSIVPEYDNLGRTKSKVTNIKVNGSSVFYNDVAYTYKTSTDGTLQTGLVSSVTNTVKQSASGVTVSTSTLNCYYDDNGNITAITDNTAYLLQYVYDDLGQVIRENINTPSLSATYVYTYDDAGNITSKTRYNFTLSDTLGSSRGSATYDYSSSSWGDLLTNFYNSSTNDTIEYDAIGNPITIGYYAGDEDAYEYGYNLKWEGRQLVEIENFDEYGASVSDFTAYTYNADGIRTSKTVNGVKHEYILNGSQIIGETWEQDDVEYLLLFIYDETGSPIGIKYRTSNYAINTFDHFFFERNLQGDIVAIYNSTGEKIGTYAYTAFGEVVTTTVSGNTTLENNIVNNYNPFRYRGYYYDVETGWYYLQNRYYNPVWGRFINADGTVSTGQGLLGNNMFAYCYNNPVNGIDPCGTCFHHWKIWEDCEQCRRKTSTNITGDVGAWFEKRRAEASIWWDQKVKEVTALFNKSKQTVEDITEIIMSNAYLDAGICFGANIASSYGSFFAYDFGFRMDIIGAQLKDGSFRIGHVGRSAYTIQIFGVVIGPQNNTFETFEGDRYVEETVYFDYTPESIGSAASFPVGYHWNAYVSVWGIVTDLYDYFSK